MTRMMSRGYAWAWCIELDVNAFTPKINAFFIYTSIMFPFILIPAIDPKCLIVPTEAIVPRNFQHICRSLVVQVYNLAFEDALILYESWQNNQRTKNEKKKERINKKTTMKLRNSSRTE